MSRARDKITAMVFCTLVLAGAISEIVIKDKYYSEKEKRELTQIPTINKETIYSGQLSNDLEKYLADQFPIRDGLVSTKTITETIFGKKESNNVYFSADGYLIDAFKSYDKNLAERNINAVKKLSDELSQRDISFKVMLIPTQAQILKDKLPAFAPNLDQNEIINYAKSQGLDVTDVSKILDEHKDEYIYYKTDHHYTSLGAYYCYKAYRESIGKKCDDISAWKSETLSNDFRGTTYNKVNYPLAGYDAITAYYKNISHTVTYNDSYTTDSIYERKFLQGADKYAVFFNSNQAKTVVNGEGNGRLLIIKDSYANELAQFAVDDHEQTHMIDLRFFKGSVSEYIKENDINEVLVCYNVPNFVKDKSVSRCCM